MGNSLVARLEDDDATATVTAFPDGSVDHFYDVYAGGARITEREEFGERAATGRSPAFVLRESSVEAGGHAVNTAAQAHLLGEDVTLVGHLDDPVFEDLSFETISMGAPARVAVYEFDDGDVLAADPSDDVESWSFGAFRAAVGGSIDSVLSADVVFCTNWTTFDALPDALGELAGLDVDGGYLVFDPGGMSGRSESERRRLFEVLAEVADVYDVILAANGEEVRSLAAALAYGNNEQDERGLHDERDQRDERDEHEDPEQTDTEESLDGIRAAADLTAAVLHESEEAIAATESGVVREGNFEVEPVRNTGGGDRFDAGLIHALARDWSWSETLRLGNACASRYVATGESATPAELAAFLREHE